MGGSYGLTVGTGSGSGFQNLQLPDNHPNKLQEGLVASTISQNQQFSQEQAAIIQNQIRQQSGSFPRQQPTRQQPPRQQTPAVRQFQPTQDRFQAQTPQQQSPPRRQQQPQHFQQSQPQQQQPSPPFNFHQPQQGQSRFSLEATLGPVGNQGLFQSRPQPQQFQPEPEQFQPEPEQFQPQPQEPRFQLEPQPRPQQPQPQQFRPEPAVRQSSRSRQSTRVAVNERPRPTVQTPVNQPESQFDSGHHTPELSRYQQYKLRQRQKQETAPQVPSAPVESPQERVVAVRRKKPARVFSEK